LLLLLLAANVNVQTSSIVMAALASQAHRKTNFDPHKVSKNFPVMTYLDRHVMGMVLLA
jgi:hypothetical protein